MRNIVNDINIFAENGCDFIRDIFYQDKDEKNHFCEQIYSSAYDALICDQKYEKFICHIVLDTIYNNAKFYDKCFGTIMLMRVDDNLTTLSSIHKNIFFPETFDLAQQSSHFTDIINFIVTTVKKFPKETENANHLKLLTMEYLNFWDRGETERVVHNGREIEDTFRYINARDKNYNIYHVIRVNAYNDIIREIWDLRYKLDSIATGEKEWEMWADLMTKK